MRNAMLGTIMFVVAALCFMPPSYVQAAGDDKTTMQDVQKETQDLISKLKDYAADQRDEAILQTEQALKKMDARIDALETDFINGWDQMDNATREKSQTGLKELRKQRIVLAEWYGSMKNSSAGAWEDMKKGFSNAYQSIADAWTKAKSEY